MNWALLITIINTLLLSVILFTFLSALRNSKDQLMKLNVLENKPKVLNLEEIENLFTKLFELYVEEAKAKEVIFKELKALATQFDIMYAFLKNKGYIQELGSMDKQIAEDPDPLLEPSAYFHKEQ